MEYQIIKEKTIHLIDELKSTCQTYGMGNDGNEYKIITQLFLYKFLNDKFGYEVKKISPKLTEKLDGSNLVIFKKNDELYIAQRNNIFKINELEENKDKLYKGLLQWINNNRGFNDESY